MEPQENNAAAASTLGRYHLRELMEQLKLEDSWDKNGRGARTLYKNSAMRLVLNCMRKGTEIKPHQANGPISVQVLEGKLIFRTETEVVQLAKGEMITLQEYLRHSVEALEDTSFLLTIAPLPSAQP